MNFFTFSDLENNYSAINFNSQFFSNAAFYETKSQKIQLAEFLPNFFQYLRPAHREWNIVDCGVCATDEGYRFSEGVSVSEICCTLAPPFVANIRSKLCTNLVKWNIFYGG